MKMKLFNQNTINLPPDVDKSKLIKIAQAEIPFNLSQLMLVECLNSVKDFPFILLLACCVMESKPLYIFQELLNACDI